MVWRCFRSLNRLLLLLGALGNVVCLLMTDYMRRYTGSVSRTLTGTFVTFIAASATHAVRIRTLIMLCLKDGLQCLGRLSKTSRTAL